jgi:hypothetical protein
VYPCFKYRLRIIRDYESEGLGYSHCYSSSCNNNTNFNKPLLPLSKSIKRCKLFIKYVFAVCYRHSWNCYFFITQYIINNKERKARLEEHYKRLKDEVFDRWLRIDNIQTNVIKPLPPSFIVSYVDIVSRLESHDRFNQAMSHLKHRDYKKANDLFTKIIKDEQSHNKNVADFITSINDKIIQTINLGNTACKINPSLQQTDDPNQPPYYSINSIHAYIQAELRQHSALKIDVYDEKFVKLYREDDNSIIIAVGDMESIECLKNRIENDLRPPIITKLKELVQEINQIDNTYKEFCIEIKSIKIAIEEYNFKGKCMNKYCSSMFK